MRVILHPEADQEFQQAIESYQAESVALGLRFYRAVTDAVARIEADPKAWPRLRCLGQSAPDGNKFDREVIRLPCLLRFVGDLGTASRGTRDHRW